MISQKALIAKFGILIISALPVMNAIAGPTVHSSTSKSFFTSVSFKASQAAVSFIPFTAADALTGAPMTGAIISLGNGRSVTINSYLNDLNAIERELSSYGSTLRSAESNLGTVAHANTRAPKLSTSLPESSTVQANGDYQWSHELKHSIAFVRASGRLTQKGLSPEHPNGPYDRTTLHNLEGRFVDDKIRSIAQVIQRIVRTPTGQEQRETQVYVDGRQIFRRGRIDAQEARVWSTAFDVPIKEVTLPIGPASINAKVGLRGKVNIDLELNPVSSTASVPQFALDFMPQVVADGYVTAESTPTNVGDAGIEGAITLADNTLKVSGTAAISFSKGIELKQATVDNIFAGFNGRVSGFVNVKIPSRSGDNGNMKHFEKEFYRWDGVRVEKRLYEYKPNSPVPSPL
jgi:hypothetical protein